MFAIGALLAFVIALVLNIAGGSPAHVPGAALIGAALIAAHLFMERFYPWRRTP